MRRAPGAHLANHALPRNECAPSGTVQQAFDRFTLRVRIVLALSGMEAGRLNQSHIGTEHLLLALTQIPECIACRALISLGVDLDQIQDATESALTLPATPERGAPALTPAAKRVLQSAVAEARTLADEYVGTEHLLLGLLGEADGVAGAVLADLGVQRDTMLEAMRLVVAAPPVPDSA